MCCKNSKTPWPCVSVQTSSNEPASLSVNQDISLLLSQSVYLLVSLQVCHLTCQQLKSQPVIQTISQSVSQSGCRLSTKFVVLPFNSSVTLSHTVTSNRSVSKSSSKADISHSFHSVSPTVNYLVHQLIGLLSTSHPLSKWTINSVSQPAS